MAIRDILPLGTQSLYEPSELITEFASDELDGWVKDMCDTMEAQGGVGLAAPQIGINKQIMIYGMPDGHPRRPELEAVPYRLCLNPVVEVIDDTLIEDGEGCLCAKELYGILPRYSKVKMTYFNFEGAPREIIADDYHARMIQHECDHLEGKLYFHRMTDMNNLGYREPIVAKLYQLLEAK
tara:strand:+ start:23619 stop:24161 length:543 start_codon:yes stop_codon:yes gene_type:complete